MQVRIITLDEKKLIGLRSKMSMNENKTYQLWNKFMNWYKNATSPLPNFLGTDLFSVQIYNPEIPFKEFNEHTVFEKCAMIEVKDYDHVPQGMDQLTLPSGMYAVFIHKGPPENFKETFNYIFHQWLPQSKYNLDNRPHFELLGKKYVQGSPTSEEEVWIPIILAD